MNQRFFDKCDTAPEWASDTAHLMSWCEGNYDFPAPSSLFLDLIGYSEEEFGENLTARKMPDLGYLEIDLLAKALTEYAKRPLDIRDFVSSLYAEPEMVECPNHEGAFDCTPFCDLCAGEQEVEAK
jgi:hypothetical protein